MGEARSEGVHTHRPDQPHSPGGPATRHNEGASSSQSASSAVPSRLLLNCFPPFTFQVPTATRTGLKFVNSDWRSDMALRILGVTIGGHIKGLSGCTPILMHFPRTPRNPARPAAGEGRRGHPQGPVAVLYEDEAKSHHEQSASLRSFCRKEPSTPFPCRATWAVTSGHRDAHPPRSLHDPTGISSTGSLQLPAWNYGSDTHLCILPLPVQAPAAVSSTPDSSLLKTVTLNPVHPLDGQNIFHFLNRALNPNLHHMHSAVKWDTVYYAEFLSASPKVVSRVDTNVTLAIRSQIGISQVTEE